MEILNIKQLITEFKTNYEYMDEDGVVKKGDYFDLDKGYLNLKGYNAEDSNVYHQLEAALDYIIKLNNLEDVELKGVYNSTHEQDFLLEYVVENLLSEGKEISVKVLDYNLQVYVETNEC